MLGSSRGLRDQQGLRLHPQLSSTSSLGTGRQADNREGGSGRPTDNPGELQDRRLHLQLREQQPLFATPRAKLQNGSKTVDFTVFSRPENRSENSRSSLRESTSSSGSTIDWESGDSPHKQKDGAEQAQCKSAVNCPEGHRRGVGRRHRCACRWSACRNRGGRVRTKETHR